jgi:hypothetical protein
MRVYFLGAGASKSFYPALPTASELTLRQLPNRSNYEAPPCGAIESLRVFAYSQKQPLDAPIENIVDLFDTQSDQFLNLRICLMSRLWVGDRANIGPLVSWLANVRESGAVLLTTNYDTVLERGIAKSTKPIDPRSLRDRGLIDYGIKQGLLLPGYQGVACSASPNSIRLLKLHGSISWEYCAVCNKGALDPAYRDRAADALSGIDVCENCSSPLSPVLVGPAKKHYNHSITDSIFGCAKQSLEQAEQIVFAGFSLGDGDDGIRELLWCAHRKARTARVFVVDQSDKTKERYRDIYQDALQDVPPMDWKQYLSTRTKYEGD